jgi:hypothetical protein
MDKSQFFLLCAGLAAIAALMTWAFDRPLRAILEGSPAREPLLAEQQADPHAETELGR